MGQQVGGKNAFIYFLKFELKNFFIEVQKKAFKHDLNNYVAGEDIMEVGMGKQTGQSSQETQADLKSCLRPLIASRVLWGK